MSLLVAVDCVVLQYGEVTVMRNTFTNECVDMHFMCDFCSGSDRITVVKL